MASHGIDLESALAPVIFKHVSSEAKMFPVRRNFKRSDWRLQKQFATGSMVFLIIFLILVSIKLFRRIEVTNDMIAILAVVIGLIVLYNARQYFYRKELEAGLNSDN
jgi:hypothetical protein